MSDQTAQSSSLFSTFAQLLSREARENALRHLQEQGFVNDLSLARWQAELADPRNDVRASPMLMAPLIVQLRDALEKNGGELSSNKTKDILSPVAQALTVVGKQSALDHRRLAGATALDFGAGVTSAMSCAIVLFANGFGRTVAYEPFPIDAPCVVENVRQTVMWLLQDPGRLNFSGISASELKQRVALLDLTDLDARFARINAEEDGSVDLGGVTLVKTLSTIQPGTLDLIFSNAVLEHLSAPLAEMKRLHDLMSDTGVAVHTVDFSDHRAWEVDGPIRNHFEFYYDGVQETTNGLRPSEMEAIFGASGFGGDRINVVNAPSGYINAERQRIPRYHDFSVEELSVMVNTYILSRKPRIQDPQG